LPRPPQTDLGETGLGDAGVSGPQSIKPEHLSTVIAAGHADFLVVIGDRNMRNDTVQARRSGKLIETPITDRIASLLEAWGVALGLRPPAGAGASGSGGAAASAPDASLSDRAIAGLGEEALFERLKRLTGIAHPQERISRLVATAGEVADMRRARRGAPALMAAGDRLTESDHTFVSAAACRRACSACPACLPLATPPPRLRVVTPHPSPPLPLPLQIAKLTKSQTALIRMHRELVDAAAVLRKLPVTPSAAGGKGGAGGGAAPGAPPHLDLGLGAGIVCSAAYKPNPPGGGLETTGVPPRRETGPGAAAVALPVPAALRDRLLALAAAQRGRLEEVGAQIAEAAGAAFAMWSSYIKVRLVWLLW